MKRLALILAAALASGAFATGFRINQQGRILGPVPVVTTPTLFNTHQADSIVSAMQIFPITSAWNEDVSQLPLLSNSASMIAGIKGALSSSRQTLRLFTEMNYVLVPDSQKQIPITFVDYPDESDPSPYPIPSAMPIESWPVGDGAGQTIAQWQEDAYGVGGDRHGIVVQPWLGNLYETWQMLQNSDGSWQASNGAKFLLNSNYLRPDGWTSGDAAGLAMFPALVRFDECARGMVEHCMRLCVPHTRAAHLYPARHQASVPYTTDPNVPAMGQRLRLKASFVIPSTWNTAERAVALGLKKYGCLVADNGNFFSISICPDNRFPDGCFGRIQTLDIVNFEVVQSTGPTGGPRSPYPVVANTGPNQSVAFGTKVNLNGSVSGGSAPVHIQWYKYSGPGSVSFSAPNAAVTAASFSAKGTYVLMLKATDGIHAPAYDAVQVVVN